MATGVSDPTLLILEDAAPSAPSGLVDAIDVSSAQPQDLSRLIAQYRPAHVIVKAYSAAEASKYWNWTRAQAASARASGCTVGTYFWLFAAPVDPRRTARTALENAARSGINPPVIWIDVEPYVDGSCPTPRELDAAIDEVARAGFQPGVYTGQWVWDAYTFRGTTAYAHLPLWYAAYNGRATIGAPGFGGWTTAAGHQYSGSPIDLSVFRAEFTRR